MVNFKQETLNMLAVCGKTPEDVRWVGTPTPKGAYITFDEFLAAADFEYWGECGCEPFINVDLFIVGDDWWLERRSNEYDGDEWWTFRTQPKRPATHMTDNISQLLRN